MSLANPPIVLSLSPRDIVLPRSLLPASLSTPPMFNPPASVLATLASSPPVNALTTLPGIL